MRTARVPSIGERDGGLSDQAQLSIVIPAHNEEKTIGRLLGRLLEDARPGQLEIVVACNGCDDRTAAIAATFGADVTVVDIPDRSKQAALRAGNDRAGTFPRVYVDADVELGTADVVALAAAFGEPGVLAAAPERVVPYDGVGVLVRCYYDVWQALPQVRAGLFGRGVVAVSRAGYDRIAALRPVLSDDLAMSEAFGHGERRVVSRSRVIVRPPRTIADLLRRRIRVHMGNAELDRLGGRSESSRTSARTLLGLLRERPGLLARLPVFVGVGVTAKLAAKRRASRPGAPIWLRDESSRG